MSIVTVDCAGVRTAEGFWQAYIEAAKPERLEGFGRNLDALWDAIEGGGPGWPGDGKLVFIHTDNLAQLQTAGGASFLDALRTIASGATQIEVQVI